VFEEGRPASKVALNSKMFSAFAVLIGVELVLKHEIGSKLNADSSCPNNCEILIFNALHGRGGAH
jgi:hypothetical protein